MLCFNNLSFTGLFKQSSNGFVSFKLLALMKNCCNNYWTNKENRKHYKDTKNCSWNTENNTGQSTVFSPGRGLAGFPQETTEMAH